jgi:hypothetical protein
MPARKVRQSHEPLTDFMVASQYCDRRTRDPSTLPHGLHNEFAMACIDRTHAEFQTFCLPARRFFGD